MLNTVSIAIYTFLIGVFIYLKLYFAAVLLVLFIPVIFYIAGVLRKNAIKQYTKKIEQAKIDNKEHKEITPFINVNKAPWYILDLIPTVATASAKFAALRIEKKKVSTFEEFSNLIGIQPVMQDFARKIVKFK